VIRRGACTVVVQARALDDKPCCWLAIVSVPLAIRDCAREKIFGMELRFASAGVQRCDPHSTER
jgi:hypothetical protein